MPDESILTREWAETGRMCRRAGLTDDFVRLRSEFRAAERALRTVSPFSGFAAERRDAVARARQALTALDTAARKILSDRRRAAS